MNLFGSLHNVPFVCLRDIIAGGFSVEKALPSVINSLDLNAFIHSHCLTLPLREKISRVTSQRSAEAVPSSCSRAK